MSTKDKTPMTNAELSDEIMARFVKFTSGNKYPANNDEARDLLASFSAEIEREFNVMVEGDFDVSGVSGLIALKLRRNDRERDTMEIRATVADDGSGVDTAQRVPTFTATDIRQAARNEAIEEIAHWHDAQEKVALTTATMLCHAGHHLQEATIRGTAALHRACARAIRSDLA